MEATPSLTRGQVNRGLRTFITASGLWGAWGQTSGIGTAVFTGYALLLGADDSFIALFTSMAYLLAMVQLVSPLLGGHIANKKRFIISSGFCEILLRGAPALIPLLLVPYLHLPALVVLVGLSLFFGYLLSPFYSAWMANTIPEPIRARFTSRQTIISSVVAVVSGFLIGQFLDLFPEDGKLDAFIYVIAGGTVVGLLGYLALGSASYPEEVDEADSPNGLQMLLRPFKDANFRRAALFNGSWTFSMGLAGSLYSVFMLDRLGISYTEISIFNALYVVTSIGGYQLWAHLVDRFGSKPVLQLLLIPAAGMPFLWIFNQPGSYYLVPVALMLSGLVFSGIQVSLSPLLYELLPQGKQKPFYLASWSASVNLMGALGPLLGSILVYYLADVKFVLLGVPIGNLQIIFALGALARIIPMFLLRSVKGSRSVSSRDLLAQMRRGNLLSYAFNATIYNMATADKTRARAALALGRSGNPLALEQLIQALADASPQVRRSAAQALGETGYQEAMEPLMRELLNPASDIRSEAAEALGRLGHASSVDPLIDALEDPDPRMRISAIRGLAEIKGEEAVELLYWHFSSDFDSLIFPTLVDVLSGLGDRRVVKPALLHLEQFPSPAIRLQLLNSVCRALGAADRFYSLLSYEDTRRSGEINKLLKHAASFCKRSRALDTEIRTELRQIFERLIQAYETNNGEWMAESSGQAIGAIRDGIHPAEGQKPSELLALYMIIEGVNDFLESSARRDMHIAQEIFLSVCLHHLAEQVYQLDN